MVTAIKQHVTVKEGGLIEVRSPDLRPGEQAEVIVLVEARTDVGRNSPSIHPRGGWRRYAGAIHSGDPHSADNDRIDADLAREYLNTHEPRPGQ
jgi:hypothetical protein